jgi:hypothetical protein
MSTLVGGVGTAALRARALEIDGFPRTKRPLPWLLAGFLALLFLVPVDSTDAKIHLPVNSHIDRFAIVVMVIGWIVCGGDQRTFAGGRRSKLFAGAVFVFAVIAVASLLFDAPRIVNLGQLTLAEKRFATLFSYLTVGWFALTAIRREDLRGFVSYLIGLACITSLGVLVERRTGYNAFYNLSEVILKPIATVGAAPTNIHPTFGSDGRLDIVGPTIHGLAVTAMLTMVMPFALVRMFDATTRRLKIRYALATLLILGGAMSTDKKTAVVVPLVMILYIGWYRRRQILRLVPVGLILLVPLVHFVSPGALGSIFDKNNAVNSDSTLHRAGDISSLVPDILAHPVLGRGFGTLNPDIPTQFRINDNEYLDEAWEVGIVGLLAYIAMIIAPIASARRSIKSRDPMVQSVALAASAGCICYLTVSALFDAFSFVQAPYTFFIVAAVATAASAPEEATEVAPKLRTLIRHRYVRPRETLPA